MNWLAALTSHGYWLAALALIALVLFGIPEFAAIRYGGTTFSHYMASVANAGAWGKMWVLLWGMLIGALAVHFLGWCMYQCPGGTLTGG